MVLSTSFLWWNLSYITESAVGLTLVPLQACWLCGTKIIMTLMGYLKVTLLLYNNPSCAEFFWENIKIHLHFASFLNTETLQVIEIHSQQWQHYPNSIACSGYHSCWWRGDTSTRDISSNGVDLVCLQCSGLSTRRVKLEICLFHVNSSHPEQDTGHFAGDIFGCIFVSDKFCILIKIPLKFVPKGPIDNNPALV